jgi:PAS domain S-box-containing protein
MAWPNFEELLRLWWEQFREHALIALDRTGAIVAWGGEAESLFGYRSDEIIGKNCETLFTAEDVKAGAPLKERKIADAGAPAEDDRWMLRRDGSRFWATGVVHALHDASGQPIGYSKILRNRTDLKGQLETQKREIRRLQSNDERKSQFITTLAIRTATRRSAHFG